MQSALRLLDRPNISDDVAERLRELIVDGVLGAGERINEVRLAAELGVSRTPLREALGRLQAEGAVHVVPRVGFFVHPLSLEEFRQIYPIRAILDPEALRITGIPDESKLRELATLNAQIRGAQHPIRVRQLDDKWHLTLLEHCSNRVLVDLIKQFMRRTRRYELALMRDGKNVIVSTRGHDQIVAALRKRDLRGACRALQENITHGIPAIERWLEGRAK